jgi:hypothetical protein
MDSIIAVRITVASGRHRYFLTWGRLGGGNDPWPGDIERAILKALKRWALHGEPVSATVCDSLQEASGERYFYERLSQMQHALPPVGKRYLAWATRMTAAVLRGEQLYYCGLPRAEEEDRPSDPAARFGFLLECFDRKGELVAEYDLDGLTADDVQRVLGDEDIDRVMCLSHAVAGNTLAALIANRPIAVDEQAYDYYVSPWADRGYRTPRGYFPPPRQLPPTWGEVTKVRPR